MSITCRAVTPQDAAIITDLFGAKGACGGCWCMHWRVGKGGATWAACKGEPNRRAFLRLLRSGEVQGALAFEGEKPVGWCSFGPREDFQRLKRARVLHYKAAPDSWSVNCFYIAAGWRKRGIATELLKETIVLAFERGAKVLEAYPTPQRSGESLAAAFA